MTHSAAKRMRGFTLLEMMVVITIMLLLLSMAIPIYSRSVKRKNEEVFLTNLQTLNQVIYQYTLDKKKAPKSLQDLIQAKYLKEIPNDITGRNDTWAVDEDESIMSPEQTETGVTGVHSGSSEMSIDGTPYSSW